MATVFRRPAASSDHTSGPSSGSAPLEGVVLLATYTHEGNAFIPVAGFALAVALYTVFHPEVRKKSQNHAVAHSLLEIEDAAAEAAEAAKAAEVARGNGNASNEN